MRNGTQAVIGLLVLAASACGDQQYDGDAVGPQDPGNNVGFGGAQDIGQFRQILEEGGIPGASTLDSGGFFAEHYAEQPPADCGQALCLNALTSVGENWITNEVEALLHVSLASATPPGDAPRPPLDLVLVVDISGSMAEDNRLEHVKQGMQLLVEQLADGDRLGLVTYSTEARVEVPFGPLDRAGTSAAISGLHPEAATNLHAGLELGFQELLTAEGTSGRQRRVILLSDGLPTAGVVDSWATFSMAEGYVARGLGLSTIGVGRSFGVELMRGLAERGAGSFYFLEDGAAIEEVFTEELATVLLPIAVEVELRVTAADPFYPLEVLGTNLWQPAPRGGLVRLPAVFLVSRTSDDPGPGNGRRGGGSAIILRLGAAESTAFGRLAETATVTLSYRLPDSAERLSQVVHPDIPGGPDAHFTTEAMAEHYAMLNVFLGLREAAYRAQSGLAGCALPLLEELDADAARFNSDRGDEDIDADRLLIQRFAANLRESGAATADAYCAPGDTYYPGYDGGYYHEDGHYHGCRAVPGRPLAGGLLGLLAILALLPGYHLARWGMGVRAGRGS